MDDIFTIQDEITRTVVEKLKIRLLQSDTDQIMKRRTENVEALQLYLKGRYNWNRRYEGGLLESIGYFQKAIEADPDFAKPYAGLADAHIMLAFWAYQKPQEALPKAREFATRALKIDPKLAEAYTALGCVNVLHDWDWKEAGKNFNKAIELNLDYATVHSWYATFYYLPQARFDEAVAQNQLAKALDPLSLQIGADTGEIYYFARELDKAVVHFKKTFEMDPNYFIAKVVCGMTYSELGKHHHGIEMLEQAFQFSQRESAMAAGCLGYAYGKNNQRDKAMKMLEHLNTVAQERYIPDIFKAVIHCGLDENESALDLLEKACSNGETMCMLLKVWCVFDGLGSDKRFKTLLKKLKLN